MSYKLPVAAKQLSNTKLVRKSILVFLFLLSLQPSNAQKIKLGAEIGYGRTYITEHFSFNDFYTKNVSLGLDASIKIDTAALWLTTGITYQRDGDAGPSLNFLMVPVGVEVYSKNRLCPIIGLGVYGSYLFYISGSVEQENADSNRDFQFGAYFDAGIKYKLTKTWDVFLKVKANVGLTNLSKTEIHSEHGTDYECYKPYDFMLKAGVNYMIK